MQASCPWRSAGRTDTGKVRERNEDAFFDGPQQGLWVVADGMGGHQAGDIASQLIVARLAELSTQGDFSERLERIRQCLHWLNRRLLRELTLTAGQHDNIMGSTVVTLLLEGNRAACIWAGDSRCYLWRGQCLYLLSRDHSLQQQLVDEQHMTPEDANRHPGGQALTRAIGAAESLKLELLELETHPGDVFLLCSDGLYHGLSPHTLGAALSRGEPHSALQCLFDEVLHGAARDNFTGVVIRR